MQLNKEVEAAKALSTTVEEATGATGTGTGTAHAATDAINNNDAFLVQKAVTEVEETYAIDIDYLRNINTQLLNKVLLTLLERPKLQLQF